jgi:hypothetical protein
MTPVVTPTTDSESFPLPDFEDRLWGELAELHTGRQRQRQGPEPGDARRVRRGRARRRYLAAVAVLSAAASLAALAIVVTRDGPDASTESPPADGPAPDTGGTDPVPDSGDAIVLVEELSTAQGPEGWAHTTWTDETTGASHSMGAPFPRSQGSEDRESAYAVETDPTGAQVVVQREVDHGRREFWERVARPEDQYVRPGRTSDHLQQEIDEGSILADGREVVDGVELLRFVSPPPPLNGCPPAELGVPTFCQGVEMTVHVTWADPSTMRPVKQALLGVEQVHHTTTYTYLPRTPENVALVEMAIPDGYARVEAPAPRAPRGR